jgi:transglutaminase-like putative cysteine protease
MFFIKSVAKEIVWLGMQQTCDCRYFSKIHSSICRFQGGEQPHQANAFSNYLCGMEINAAEWPTQAHLAESAFMDFSHPLITALVAHHTHEGQSQREKAVALYLAVRDGIRYSPYHIDLSPAAMVASHLLVRGTGYCVEKANLLAAVCRAVGIPSRLGFAKVRNHIGTERIEAVLGTDELVFHGYTDLWIDGKWVKATPAFNRELCDKFGVPALDFDGTEDSIFQTYNAEGDRFMEYLHDYGTFVEVPHDLMVSELMLHYGHLFVERDGRLIFELSPL